MMKRNHKLISSLPLIATTLFVSSSAVLAQNTNARNQQACATTAIQKHVLKLGTTGFVSSDLNVLVQCKDKAISVLETALNSKSSNLRASAAYVLGEIAVKNQSYRAIDSIKERQLIEKDSVVLQILQSYKVEDTEEICLTFRCPGSSNSPPANFPVSEPSLSRRASPISLPADFLLPPSAGTVYRGKIVSTTNTSSPIICSLPGIRSILPRCK
jgi:hypothetical protein